MSLKVFARGRNVPANKGIPLLRVYSVCVLDRGVSHCVFSKYLADPRSTTLAIRFPDLRLPSPARLFVCWWDRCALTPL